MSDKVELYLSKKKQEAKTSEIAQVFQTFESFYKKKLWHQLTQELRKQVNDPAFVQQVDLKEFYENFISDLEFRINLLNLAEIAMPVARKIFETDNKQAAFDFLKKMQNTVKKDKQATIRVASGLIELQLANKDANGVCVDIVDIRSLIEETQKEVDDLVGVTPVHAPFYKVSAAYLREVGDFAGYYREALRYLGCEDTQKLTEEEKRSQATLLGFAALLGEDIYNFDELLAHPILGSLHNTDQSWLLYALYSFSNGNFNKFREYESKWGTRTDIKKNMEALEGKICLLCLMAIALQRNSKDRHISFNEISKKALVDVNKVEYLVMKALSKGLVKGSIDQVNRTVQISWVQPRVLSPAQIYQMSERA